MTTIRITDPAFAEIESHYRFIAKDNPLAADEVVRRIYKTIELLSRYPRMGHKTLRRGVRMFPLRRYPYLIFFQYLRRKDELRIIAVRHAARRRLVGLADDAAEFRATANS